MTHHGASKYYILGNGTQHTNQVKFEQHDRKP